MSLYGFEDSDWTDDQRRAVKTIAGFARRGKTLTYGQLVEAVGSPRYIPRRIGKLLLDDVDRLTHDTAGCAISAIVINKKTSVSGKGLNEIGEDLGIEGAAKYGFRDKQQEQVFAYFQSLSDEE